MDTTSLVIAIIAFVLGIGLIYWVNRRKFYRRNMAGMEGFSSFEKSVIVRFMERIGKLLGYALIIIGFLFLWIANIVEKDKKRQEKIKTEQPARVSINIFKDDPFSSNGNVCINFSMSDFQMVGNDRPSLNFQHLFIASYFQYFS